MEKLYTKITIIAVITFIVILLLGNEIIRFSFMSYTVNKLTIKQIEVMKSKFIAYIFPLNAEEDLVKEALLAGAKNYIVKPITQNTVLDRVATVLAQSQKEKE